jgi:hypothetical protein
MIELQANERLLLLFSESKGISTGWKSHDRNQGIVPPFIAYIGGKTKDELKQVVSTLECSKIQIRKAKRLQNYPFEAKIWGAPYEDVRNLGFWLKVERGVIVK